MVRQVAFALTISLGLSGLGGAHSGMVDGYALPSGRGQGQLSLSPGAIYWPDVQVEGGVSAPATGRQSGAIVPEKQPTSAREKDRRVDPLGRRWV